MKFSKERLIVDEYKKIEKGKLFSTFDFSVHVGDKKLQWILREHIKKGEVIILFSKVYYKIKMNKFFPDRILSPDIQLALKVLSKRTDQKFQEHG